MSSRHVKVPMPTGIATSAETDHDDEWRAKLSTTGPADIIVQDVVYQPGGHTGWHSHPGILLSSVVSGIDRVVRRSMCKACLQRWGFPYGDYGDSLRAQRREPQCAFHGDIHHRPWAAPPS
jgi:hypothetical protein